MIDADFSRTQQGFKVRIVGHAGYGGEGEDIVCAAVSGIFYALCGYAANFKPRSIKVNAIESGLADIECGLDCEEQLKLACLGIWQIANTYPGHVRVNNGAWNWHLPSAAACRE